MEGPTCRKFRQVRKEGNREVQENYHFINLDMIISLGYRVNLKLQLISVDGRLND